MNELLKILVPVKVLRLKDSTKLVGLGYLPITWIYGNKVLSLDKVSVNFPWLCGLVCDVFKVLFLFLLKKIQLNLE